MIAGVISGAVFTILYYWNERQILELELLREQAEKETIKARDALDIAERERNEALSQIGEVTEEIEVLRRSRVGLRNQITILTVADKEAQTQIDDLLIAHRTTIDELLSAPPPPDYETCVETLNTSTALIGVQSNAIINLRQLDGVKSTAITSLTNENVLLQKNFDRLFKVHTNDVQTFAEYQISIEHQLDITEQELSAMKRKSAFSFLRPKIVINLISVGFGFDDQKIHPMIGIGVGWAF